MVELVVLPVSTEVIPSVKMSSCHAMEKMGFDLGLRKKNALVSRLGSPEV